jgi:glutamate synthase (NADPH/NADH) small chain
MGEVRGFLERGRQAPQARPVAERVRDYEEYELPLAPGVLQGQAGRCMDCGVPFCHHACPLGNLVPEWNEWVRQGRMEEAWAALHATNNFPEVTGRVCPAPCEASCVLGLEKAPVTIKAVERAVAEAGRERGWLVPRPAARATGRSVGVVGSGPAGLAAAQQLARRGHAVTVYERADRPGGLLRYGIPDFKLSKALVEARVAQLQAEGVVFVTGVHAGVDLPADALRARHEALVLCGGATRARRLEVPGAELAGVHPAMDFLTAQNRRVAGLPAEGPWAEGLHVVVLGGGDTGSDCVGTSLRQGAASVTSLELMPAPPRERLPENPWPEWPLVLRTSSSHEEGGARDFGVRTVRLTGEGGRVRSLEAVRVERRVVDGRPQLVDVPGPSLTLPADLVLLAMGFTGPEPEGLLAGLGVALDGRGNVQVRGGMTSVPGVFAAGDMARGQSLVVWAIAEGRRVAEAVDRWLAVRGAPGRGEGVARAAEAL